MAPPKSERLMNLFIALLVSRQYVTKERLREAIEGYRELSEQAFDRMFERDKDELRELGIPIETGTDDAYFDDELGYRVPRAAVELPPVELTSEESAVVGLASRVWQHAGLATQSTAALLKLKAAGVDVNAVDLGVAEPRLQADEPAFEDVWDATLRRTPIAFDYRKPGGERQTRRIQPAGVVSWRGRWYVGGHDLDRDGVRLFRLSRVVSKVEGIGEPGSYDVPGDVDMRDLARSLFPAAAEAEALVRVRHDRGHALRRRASRTQPAGETHDEMAIAYTDANELAEEIAALGPDAVALDPPEVREVVIAKLRSAAGVLG